MTAIASSQGFGATIRAERKRQRLTQTELADLCAVSLSFVSDLENGKPTAELEKSLRVARTLGFDVALAKRGE